MKRTVENRLVVGMVEQGRWRDFMKRKSGGAVDAVKWQLLSCSKRRRRNLKFADSVMGAFLKGDNN